MKLINKYLRNLLPYKVASHKIWEVSEEQRRNILKLDWNEATIPPTPLVMKSFKDILNQDDFSFLYPSTHNAQLLNLLAQYCSIDESCVQYFASSDGLHEYLVRMYVSIGDPILILGPTYDNFRLTCESQGGIVHIYEYSDNFELDKEKFVNSIKTINPSLVYICNPNNPTGNVVEDEFIISLLNELSDTVFIIDEAYFEFYGKSLKNEVMKFENLFVTRTFSKAFALANFRAGYLISHPDNIKQVSKIRNAKNISTFTQTAMIAALSDIPYMHNFVQEVHLARKEFSNGLKVLPSIETVFNSEGNFVLVKFIDESTKKKANSFLIENDIFVRNLEHSAKLIQCLRITIGTRAQMQRVLDVLKQV